MEPEERTGVNPYLPQKRFKPNIRIYQPLKIGSRYISDITQYATMYRQAIRLYGGYWTATWNMENLSATSMRTFFKQKIGNHMAAYSGGTKIWGFLFIFASCSSLPPEDKLTILHPLMIAYL